LSGVRLNGLAFFSPAVRCSRGAGRDHCDAGSREESDYRIEPCSTSKLPNTPAVHHLFSATGIHSSAQSAL
jgi:hypothetical protein